MAFLGATAGFNAAPAFGATATLGGTAADLAAAAGFVVLVGTEGCPVEAAPPGLFLSLSLGLDLGGTATDVALGW